MYMSDLNNPDHYGSAFDIATVAIRKKPIVKQGLIHSPQHAGPCRAGNGFRPKWEVWLN